MNYNNIDSAKFYKELCSAPAFDVKARLDSARISSFIVDEGPFKFSYAALPVDDKIIDIMQNLADEQQLVDKYKELLSGERVNTGENRMVLHQLARGRVLDNVDVYADGVEKGAFYEGELAKIKEFSEAVRNGSIKGSTGKKFSHVVQIGIGGSDLGPRALCYALALTDSKPLDARFISNVDPDDAALVLRGLDLESTLFILVSKSGTTQETLTNRDLVINTMRNAGIKNPLSHIVAVTSNTSPLASTEGILKVFFMDDYIGGRYSSSSAVGGVILSLTYGFDTFKKFLDGAHYQDTLCLEKDIRKNASLLDALIGIYLRNALGYPYSAVLPYSQCLNRFPAHLQQLDMESNGKHVNRFGEKINYSTGPVIFGEPGTNGQHSFYQLLHQGTDRVPMQFIGFRNSQGSLDLQKDGSTSQEKLKANLAAQIVAFARGKDDVNSNKSFDGQRYSSLLVADKLDAYSLGVLLAHYENKVMFQGFAWNINSFDQEGVQLGKILAKKVLSGCEGDSVLASYANMLK